MGYRSHFVHANPTFASVGQTLSTQLEDDTSIVGVKLFDCLRYHGTRKRGVDSETGIITRFP
jgi:hypothetical protein